MRICDNCRKQLNIDNEEQRTIHIVEITGSVTQKNIYRECCSAECVRKTLLELAESM